MSVHSGMFAKHRALVELTLELRLMWLGRYARPEQFAFRICAWRHDVFGLLPGYGNSRVRISILVD